MVSTTGNFNTITLDSVKVNIALVGNIGRFDNKIILARLEGSEGLKVENIKLEKIASSSPFGHGAQNDVYLLPKELVE